MQVDNLRQLFQHCLSDLYSAEEQIIAALPTMIEAATDQKLQQALSDHLEVTEEQLARLNTITLDLNLNPNSQFCQGIAGIIKEGESLLPQISDPATKDAAIIGAAQKVEHYEIATYGTALEFARQLELDETAELLEKILNEEKQADQSLSALATGGFLSEGLNKRAADQ